VTLRPAALGALNGTEWVNDGESYVKLCTDVVDNVATVRVVVCKPANPPSTKHFVEVTDIQDVVRQIV
jgi:hypothetical protein